MYCKQCGKEIEDGRELCQECEVNELFGDATPKTEEVFQEKTIEQPQSEAVIVEGSRKTGRFLGVMALVFGLISAFLGGLAYGWCMGILESLLVMEDFDAIVAWFGVYGVSSAIIAIFSLIFAVPSIIFGILGIVCFVKEAKAKRLKPVATLVLSIIGLVQCLGGVFYAVIILCLIVYIMLIIGIAI